MGLMTDPTSGAQLVLTPHPVTLEGQRHMVAAMEPGEKLGTFLARTVPDWHGDAWEVRINGVLVPVEILDRVRPKETALVEVRGIVKKQALAIVAMVVLAYFTMGAGLAAYGAAVGVTSAVGLSVLGAVTFAAGSALINKLLMPKPSAPTAQQSDPVHSINSARNAPRPYEPLPILFGTVRITPDVASMPYTWYEGNDQILGMVLTPGVNVHSIEALYNGDTLLSSYEGVATYLNGLPGHADQTIPLYSNADTIAGGTLESTGAWIERTTPDNTVRIQINLEYILGDQTSKGRPYNNRETVQVQRRATGSETWQSLTSRTIVNNNYDQKRATLSADVPAGQYDVRVRRLGQAFEDLNGKAEFSFVTMTAVQADDTDYTGIPRIGIRITATGQLNGALDEVRCVAHSMPVPVWDGSAWNTQLTSNPGAHLLSYARGIYDANGRILAGIGLPDAQIDIDALQAFMLHCEANGFTYDAYIKDARNHQEMVNAIALAGFGHVTWASGKFSVVWAADSQPLSGVVNMATIKKGSFQVDYTLANAADGIEYTYIDPETWKPATLRVAAPGVETMQNPARITGEGITDETHAAKMARYHLAQHLYQYKDISYSTDLEHLTYRRMSVLSLSHDMTQWGYSGRLRGAVDTSGTVTLTLDEPVPAPPSGNAFIGLRIPGEGAFRVFPVASFEGESNTLTLVGEWPVDAAFPGDADDNPAHDTIWTYDFKATPGYRVRVVQIEPESDLQGARVAVVPESPEFWTYVETGEYTPPSGGSLLLTRPVASNLRITESQVVQGDTVFTQLQAAFDVTGPMAYATVHVAQQLDGEWGELRQVAETRTQEATFRVPSAGIYTIVVRPYNADGIVGGVVSAVYATIGADIPPPPFDSFDVQALPGGVRKYTWSYNADTLQAADFAGAEIRYTAGEVGSPEWSSMTPVGDDGFHTSAFETVIPESGTWTFAARARNTSGDLSAPVVIIRELTENLGEVIDSTLDELIELQTAIDQETADRIAADLQTAIDAAADAQSKANAARDAALAAAAAAQASVDALAADVAEIVGAPEWEATVTYNAGWLVKYDGALYRAIVETTGDQPDTSPGEWEKLGDYASLAEAVAAALSIATTAASEIAAEAVRIDALYARMPAGTGDLATEAMVLAEASALATEIAAEATRINGLVARMPGGSGLLATQASVSDVASVAASATAAVSARTATVEARMPSGSGQLGTAASVTAAQDAAQAASDLAGGKGKVFFQSTAPATAERLSQNLWIDTASGNNTPKRWNGTAWVAVTDKAATDAAAAAAAALTHSQAVDARVTTVENASVSRDNALSSRVGVVEARMPSGSGALATSASVTAAESASVTRDNALGSRIGVVEARMPTGSGELATAAGLTATQATVSAQGGQITALASDLSSVQVTVGNQSASLTQLAEVQASDTSSLVILDAGFEQRNGWQLQTETGYSTASPQSGNYCLRFNNTTESKYIRNAGITQVRPGQKIRFQFWTRATSVNNTYTARFGASFYDASGALLGGTANNHLWSMTISASHGHTLREVDWVVPSDVFSIRVYCALTGGTNTDGTGDRNFYFDNISATPVDENLDNRVRAMHTVALNVNGYVSGTVNENDGQTSQFSILADIFRVIGGGAEGMEWQNGYLRVYGSGYQRILGYNFGASGQNLVDWFGPNVGAAAASKANATMWMDKAGNAYWGGTLSAGILKNAARSTVLGIGHSLLLGPFTTLGNPKQIVVSWSASSPLYTNYYPHTGGPSGPNNPNSPPANPTPPSGNNSVTSRFRRAGTGSWTNLPSISGSTGITVQSKTYVEAGADPNLPTGGWRVIYRWVASGTATSTRAETGTATWEVEATLVARTFPGVESQELSIISTEEP